MKRDGKIPFKWTMTCGGEFLSRFIPMCSVSRSMKMTGFDPGCAAGGVGDGWVVHRRYRIDDPIQRWRGRESGWSMARRRCCSAVRWV